MTQSFWTSVSTYAMELAPVVGSLFHAVGQTADAIERAGTRRRPLPTSPVVTEVITEDDF